ncbi:MAG: ferric reductase-like transmembrane domain-containing protein [Acetobacteraceae bacterium]|nr:ferric reductase-like transmembrane domain-containing protein [Acetobacteraceae bacterium]
MPAPAVARRTSKHRIAWPWRDRAGRFSPLKTAVLVLALVPGALIAWWLASGQMGAEPFKAAARETGSWTYRLLLLTLLVTPLRVVADWPAIVQVRRMLGLVTLGYALAHLGLYVAHLNGDLVKAATEIALRVYLTIGFIALLGLAALGITSTDAMTRRMGKGWKRLHRLVVPIALLGLAHFFIQSKADVTEPTLVAGLLLWLLAWRALPRELQASKLALFAVALVAALGTVLVEYGWYALATSIPAERVLLANLDIGYGPRPAVIVLAVGLLVTGVPWVRRRLTAISARR